MPELEPRRSERRRAGALAEVRTFGDPALRSRASEVSEFDPSSQREAQRMIAIMSDAIGVGLAATQLGIMRRLLVFQAGAEATPTALVNPEIEWLSGELVDAEEGCLSLPRGRGRRRAAAARAGPRARLHGEPLLLEASGLEARVLQHEVDHLDGVLILDRTSRDQRKAALARAARGHELRAPRDEDGPRATETREARLPGDVRVRGRRCSRRWPPRRHRPALVVTPPDRPRGRGRRLARPRSAAAARELGIDLHPDRERQPRGRPSPRSRPPAPRSGSSARSAS